MRLNRKFLYIALLAIVFTGCDFDEVGGDKDTWVPDYIKLSGTVSLDISAGRHQKDTIVAYSNEADINKFDVLSPSITSMIGISRIGTNGEWRMTMVKPFTGQKRIYFAILPETGGTYIDKETYNTANPNSDFFVNNGGVLVAVKSMNITGYNRDISNIDLGRVALDSVRLSITWRYPTVRDRQVLANFHFYSDKDCTQRVFYPILYFPQVSDKLEMLAPRNPERTLYVGLNWLDLSDDTYKTYKTGVSFSTSDTGPITLDAYDISGEY